MGGTRLLYTVALTVSACGFDASNLLPGGDDPVDAAVGDGGGPIIGDDAAPDAGPEPLDLPCRTDDAYSDREGTNRRYREISPGSYDDAIAACAADGAHLVTIEDAAENTFVNSLAAGEFWIGYDDLTAEGSFAWVTKTAAAFVGFSGPEPSNTNDEDCVVLRDNATWNDIGCELSRPAVCECDPFRAPTPVPACMTDDNYDKASDGRRRRVITSGTSWDAARDTCATSGAHLAVVGDDAENDLLDDLLASGDSWLGYRSSAASDLFRWINGAPVGFENWDMNEPNDANECAEIDLADGEWRTADCNANRDYICECDPALP